MEVSDALGDRRMDLVDVVNEAEFVDTNVFISPGLRFK
jgi:hypothetical protein